MIIIISEWGGESKLGGLTSKYLCAFPPFHGLVISNSSNGVVAMQMFLVLLSITDIPRFSVSLNLARFGRRLRRILVVILN